MKRSSDRGERFLHAFWQLRQTMLGRVKPRLVEGHGLEFLELILLRRIAEASGSPTELAESMQVPASAVSRRLDALRRGGRITRTLDPVDARRHVLRLTPAGEEVLDAANETLESEVDALLSVLSPVELERFVGAMEKVGAPIRSEAEVTR